MQLLNRFGKLGNQFVYLDTEEDLAFSIFREHQITINVTDQFQHPEFEYLINICKVPKKYHKVFDECMSELEKKMLICGHTDYEKFCKFVIEGCKGKPIKGGEKNG
jgi:hypothetical protein